MVENTLSNLSFDSLFCSFQHLTWPNVLIFLNHDYAKFFHRNKVPLMIISLGSILLKTEPRRNDTRDVAAMHVAGATSEDILKVQYILSFCLQ